MPQQTPIGDIKKLVSLVNRGDVDDFLFPATAEESAFSSREDNYHNFTSEILEIGYVGEAAWAQRITFKVPTAYADMLQWVAFVINPGSWVPEQVQRDLLNGTRVLDEIDDGWCWAANLGQIAVEKAELEIDGITVETITSEWIALQSRINNGPTVLNQWLQNLTGGQPTTNPKTLIQATEDGNIYCWLPFAFSRLDNTAFPLCSVKDRDIYIHVTLRRFPDVVRKIRSPRTDCEDTPLGVLVQCSKGENYSNNSIEPTFKTARILLGVSYLDDSLRKRYIDSAHEILYEPVQTVHFEEPLKYTTSISSDNTILVGLPLFELNGPIRELYFIIRRKANSLYNAWNNFGTYLENEILTKQQLPLLEKARLLVGTVTFVEQDEFWFRTNGVVGKTGAGNLYTEFIYRIPFDGDSTNFSPNGGSLNASRTEMRLDLTIRTEPSVFDKQWEVIVFAVGFNWIRFQNGMAQFLFKD